MSAARLALAVVIICLLLPAESAIGQPAESGFYVGARAGAASMETPTVRDREGPGLQSYDRRDVMWSVFGGHDWLVRSPLTVGVEIGYSDNGAATITYASANVYAFASTQFDILGTAAVTYRRIAVGVKAGVGRTREQYRISTYISGTPDINSEQTKDLPVGAITVSYEVTSLVTVFLDARRTFGDVADTVTKALVNSNPTPPPYRDVLNSVSRVTALSFGVKITLSGR
jgi:hypothetical protein